MAEFDDLMAGIRAHPHDELRRLVFADWLDENAHANPVYGPWAGYIRWAIAATRTPRTDPDYWTYRRYPEPPPDGVAKLLRVDSRDYKFDWTGGFPDSVHLAPDTLQAHDRQLAALPGPIRRLSVLPRIATLLRQAGVSPIDSLLTGELTIPPVPVRWVFGPTVGRAGALEVDASEIDAAMVLATLAQRADSLPPLTLLLPGTADVLAVLGRSSYPSLVGLTVDGLNAPQRLAASPDLARLTSFGLNDSAGPPGAFAVLPPTLPNLTRLSLSGTGMPVFLNAVAEGGCPGVTRLELDASVILSPGWSAFVASPAFERLSRLTWRRSHLDTSDAVSPADAPEPDAGELILNVAHLGPLRSVALFASPLLHRCECLFVENCDLTPDAYLALAANPSARNLKVLSIQMPFKSEPFARGEPVAALCRSPHFAGLTELSLTFHDLTDEDFEELLSATFAGGLRYLNLAGSYFSERPLERLTDPDVLPALTWLDIHAPTGGSRRLEPALRTRFGPHFAF